MNENECTSEQVGVVFTFASYTVSLCHEPILFPNGDMC